MSDTIASTQPTRFTPRAMSGVPASPLVNPILGRDGEVRRVRALLDGDGVRVLSLLGPGGVGKTRLALEVMRRSADDFAHGAGFVSLAPVRDHALVPFAVAQGLDVQESGSLPVTELLVAWLRSRHFLLVLDNLEQVIEAASPWMVELLASCPRLKVLVTSRIPLAIAGEQRFRVPPLPVPDLHGSQPFEGYASIQLFAQRARAIRADFILDAANRDAVARICAGLDGLPLAIELAAARTNVFTPAEVLARLTDRLDLLTADRRDAPPRLRSMRDAVGWSYDLLSAPEQGFFRRLAVFVGDFSLDAAESISVRKTGGGANPIASLVDQSLVERIEGVDETRFRMLETIREYGLAQLTERGEIDAARNAHAAFYQAMAYQAGSGLRGPDQALWLKRLETEYGNLREAMSWLTATDRVPEAVELLSGILYFMVIRAHFSEGRQLLADWLAMAELEGRTRTRALALHADGLLTVNLGDPALAVGSLSEALALFQELGDRAMTMFSLNVLTFACYASGDLERARAANDECLPMASQVGDARDLALALNHLAHISLNEDDPHRARKNFEEGLTVARTAGDLWMVGNILVNLGVLVFDVDEDLSLAGRLFEESRIVKEVLGDKGGLSVTHSNLAAVAQGQGELELAKKHLRMSTAIAQETGQTVWEAFAHRDLAEIARLEGNLQSSARELRRALELFHQVPHLPCISASLIEAAALALASGDAPQAARFLGASEPLLRQIEALPPFGSDSGEHVRLIEQTRLLLGDSAFDCFEAEGRAWSMENAVAAALAWELPATTASPRSSAGPGHRLSARELEVLCLMANGHSNQRIADELFLSRRTVTSHVTSILSKLDLTSRTQAVALAIRSGVA